MSLIGTNIKNIRIKKNISAKQLSKKCGLSESVILDIESGRKIPNTNMINAVSKALGVSVDAIEPAIFSDYFGEENEVKFQPTSLKDVPMTTKKTNPKQPEPKENSISDAFNKATRKIPVLSKITAGKNIPYEGDITDYKYEPIFQSKGNNVAGDEFIYFVIQDNSMLNSRIMKHDLALVFLTGSIMDKDIILLTYNNKALVRKVKNLDDNTILLYPDNPEYEALIVNRKDIHIVGKLVRIEFKI